MNGSDVPTSDPWGLWDSIGSPTNDPAPSPSAPYATAAAGKDWVGALTGLAGIGAKAYTDLTNAKTNSAALLKAQNAKAAGTVAQSKTVTYVVIGLVVVVLGFLGWLAFRSGKKG